jgi:DNA-binding protein H-NS
LKTYPELLAELTQLNEQIERAKGVERNTALDEIREKMSLYGISVSDLAKRLHSKAERANAGTAAAPKYRNPEDGTTWSGRGKPPHWIAGKDRASFQIR